MSLCPPSTSTSNIAFGSACDTTASITTAGSFWSPSSRSGLRAFSGRRGALRPLCFPKTRESLLARRCCGQPRLDLPRQVRGQSVGGDKAIQGLDPPRIFAHRGHHQVAAGVEHAVLSHAEAAPERELDHL